MEQEAVAGRIPPHNEEAERAVLGALLLAAERIPEVAELIGPGDFHNRRHALLYEALLALSDRGVPVDYVSVGEALKATGRFQAVGGNEFLLELSQCVTSPAHVVHHAAIVQETAVLRRLIQESTEIIEEAFTTRPDGEAVRKLLDESEHRIFAIARGGSRESADPIRALLEEAMRRVEAKSDHRITGVTTGFYDLDEKLSGLHPGDLVIVAARPAMGKTAFALNLASNAALQISPALERRANVLFFSLEMGKQQIVQRLLASLAEVDAFRLRTGHLDQDDRARLGEACGELAGAGILIDDSPGLSVMSLRGRARRVKAKHGLDLIVVDYLQLMSHPKAESRQMEISAISRSLKALARELEIPVVALAQLSRQVESRDDKRPLLSDLRESGSIEQDADIVMMLYRKEYYLRESCPEEDRGLAEVIVAKHRNGATGDVKLSFFPSVLRFANRAPTTAEPIFS